MEKFYGDSIWEKIFSSRGWGRYPSEESIRFFMYARNKISEKFPSVLDIGCGKGALSWFMSKEGAQVTAMDGAPSGVKAVAVTAAEFGVKNEIKTICGDITEPEKFVNGKFDILVDHYSICHNTKSKILKAYRSYYDILSSNGYFLTCFFGTNTTEFGSGMKVSRDGSFSGASDDSGVVTLATMEDACRILSEIGFKIEYSETVTVNRNGSIIEKIIICLRKD